MKLRQLEAIRAVINRGTTTHAAKALGLTQSAVSRLITQMENELGLSLFDRRHGRLLITPEGKLFYDVALKVLEGIDQMTATARDIRTLRAGALRIIAMPALAYGLLPNTIAKINRRHKQVKISIDVGGRRELQDGIVNGQYDLGLATLPVDPEGIDVMPLCAIDAVCVAPRDHPLAANETIAAAELAGLRFISIDPRTLLRYRTDELFGKLGIRRVLGIEAQSSMMACNLVAMGLGFSVVHPFIADLFADKVAVKPFEPTFRLEYGLLFATGQRRSLIANEFIETLRGDVAELPGMASGAF